jgi:hypothetical protein
MMNKNITHTYSNQLGIGDLVYFFTGCSFIYFHLKLRLNRLCKAKVQLIKFNFFSFPFLCYIQE